MSEETIWGGTPSQLTNMGSFLISLAGVAVIVIVSLLLSFPPLMAAVLLPIGFGFWKWIQTRCERYELTTERIRVRKGVFSVRREELELYRVKDSSLVQPFIQRVLSLGSIILMTSDRTDPEFVIPAVKDPSSLLDQIRKHVEHRRDQKRVSEVDFE